MALQDDSVRLTYDDYLNFPQDGWRHEILDGKRYVTAPPSVRHQIVQQRLNFALSRFVEPARLGQILSARVDVLLSEHDIVQPDLFFIARERLGILTERNVQGAPDLVVEILSQDSERLDRGDKVVAYERTGVGEYWIVDIGARTVTVYCAGEGGGTILRPGDEDDGCLTTSFIPGLEAPLEDLFA